MYRLSVLLVSLLVAPMAGAQPWQFNEPIEIAGSRPDVFHHLESSGRRSIAVSGQTVAVVWEDDRDGAPRVYLARKTLSADRFDSGIKVSQQGEAYEPAIAAFMVDRFVVGWEEDGKVLLRLLGSKQPGHVIKLSKAEAGQVNVATVGEKITAVFAEREGHHRRIVLVDLDWVKDKGLVVAQRCEVDPEPHRDEQLYPVIINTDKEQVVVWEDRRPGHTIIMASARKRGGPCAFSQPVRISERPPGPKYEFGKGHGVARAALAAYGKHNVYAVWADKRDFREGYDIYGAGRPHSGKFGSNVKVQDDFGEVARQWHVALTGTPNGQLVATWDDEREGNTDILMSWWDGQDWSDDHPVPGASGPGEQGHSTIVIDQSGNLHIAWVERAKVGSETRIQYLLGRAENSP